MTLPTAPRSVNASCCVQGVWFPTLLPLHQDFEVLLTRFSFFTQEQAGGRTPRRRWSSREVGSEDDLLMVKSMLDLRMLESYCAEEDEQQEVPKPSFPV